jgi:hypothetical protein
MPTHHSNPPCQAVESYRIFHCMHVGNSSSHNSPGAFAPSLNMFVVTEVDALQVIEAGEMGPQRFRSPIAYYVATEVVGEADEVGP